MIGYQAAQEIAAEATASGRGVRAIALDRGLLSAEDLDGLVSAENVTKLGSPLARKEKKYS